MPPKITLLCDEPYCGFEVQTTSPIRFKDAGCRCPECGSVIITTRDVVIYKLLRVAQFLRLARFTEPGAPGAMRISSRK